MISRPTAKDDRPVVDQLFRSLMRESELGRYLTSYPAGMAIHRYGEPCAGVLIVTQGAVRISQPMENERSRTLTIVRTGGAVGLTSCLSETPCRYTALAETAVTGYFVPIEIMQKRLAEHPEAYMTLIQLLSTSLQEAYVHLLASRVQKSKGDREVELHGRKA
jgi:CRP-like cAMP-binding protein